MTDMRDRLDPELVEPLDGLMEATGGGFSLNDIPATRAMVDAMVAAMKAEAPPIEGVAREDLRVPSASAGKATDVPIRVYRPEGAAPPLPTLIWMHGGGFVLGGIELDDLMCAQLAKDVGCAVVSVEYRLAPEHPYPAALEDCRGVLRWAARDAAEAGLDGRRIAVGGGSAGAGLAAGLTLLARDEDDVMPCFQLLVYPAINDRKIEPASESVPENLFWSRENTRRSWEAYLGGRQGTDDVEVYAAPARATDLSGLPPAYISVGSLDMFLPDCVDYAERLIAAGVDSELHVYPRAFHAFDAFAPMAGVSQRFVADRDEALLRAFD